MAAEVVCVPAIPLAASSGYLFGLVPGFVTVLLSATIAACISFFIGRTFLRGWAQKIASGNFFPSIRYNCIWCSIHRELNSKNCYPPPHFCAFQDLRNGGLLMPLSAGRASRWSYCWESLRSSPSRLSTTSMGSRLWSSGMTVNFCQQLHTSPT